MGRLCEVGKMGMPWAEYLYAPSHHQPKDLPHWGGSDLVVSPGNPHIGSFISQDHPGKLGPSSVTGVPLDLRLPYQLKS